MPVREIAPGKFRWGKHGKVGTKAEAEAQARAIYANGWREDRKARAARLKIHKALSASRQAESTYVLALLRIMGAVHRAVLEVVHKEKLHTPPPEPIERMQGDAIFVSGAGIDGELRIDADPPKVGLGAEFLRRLFKFTKPQTQAAFDKMAKQVSAKADPAMRATLERDLAKRIAERKAIVPIARPAAEKAIVDEARDENVALITGASEDFLDEVRDVLEEHENEAAEDIAAALAERVGVSKSRAVLIARDQVLKLNGALLRHRQTSAGVDRFKWSTSHDERVRPSHREVDGQTFSWDDDEREDQMADFEIADDDAGDPAPTPGSPIQCFPADSEIQLAHRVEKAFRRWFDGEVTELVTASGKTVRATPNHPVLTRRGWVAIGSLQLTDDVVELAQEDLVAFEADEHQRVTSIGDVFAALQEDVVLQPLAQLRGTDFHGDGAEGDVDVVLAARPLSFGVLAGRAERSEQLRLAEANDAGARPGAAHELLLATGRTTHSGVSGGSESRPSVGTEAPHAEQVCVGATTDRDPGLLQPRSQRDATDAGACGDGLQALAGLVGRNDGRHVDVDPVVRGPTAAPVRAHADSAEFLAQVVRTESEERGDLVQGLPAVQQFARVRSVHRLPFHGWVFNLETEDGWYAIDGIIGHNCRCIAIPLIAGLDYPDDDEETEGEEVPEGEEETEEPDADVEAADVEERDAADAFDPDQPRGEHGEWTAGAGGSKVYKTAPVKAGSQHAKHK